MSESFGTDIFYNSVGDNVVNMVHKPLADGGSCHCHDDLFNNTDQCREIYISLTYDLIYCFTCKNWDIKGKCNCY